MRRRELTALERLAVRTFQRTTKMWQGYHVEFLGEVILTHGILGFSRWGQFCWEVERKMQKAFGDRNAALLGAFASFWNGCDYCAWGCLLAHNLLYFEETGKLFPIPEPRFVKLMRQPDQVALAAVEEALADPEWAEVRRLVRLQQELVASGREPATEEERLLRDGLHLYDVLNECSIVVDAPAPPLHPVAKKTELRERYRLAREQNGESTFPDPPKTDPRA